MFWFLAIVGLAAAAVTGYTRLRQRDPDAADALARKITEATTLIVVIAQAVMTGLEAMARTTRPHLASGPRGYTREDFDD